ncbi:MAG: MATE family efflux transporter [SAR86 cluster bacterium]|nr:MATE family efflux transporter [SAR86 cluster bacterium]
MIDLNVANFYREAKRFLAIGVPILGTQIVMYGLTTTDYIMAGYYSSDDLAGLGLAASIFNPLYFLTAGVMFGINPIVAQLYGQKSFEEIKLKIRRFIWVAFFIGFLFFLALSNAYLIFNFIEAEQNIKQIAIDYLKIISLGAIPMTIYQALRGYSEGITETKTVFLISLAIFLLNIPFNYLFIFYFDLGGVGCGYATTVLVVMGLICFWLITLFSDRYKETRLYGKFINPEISSSIELFKIGIPISFGVFVELSMFSGAALIISFFGATALAGHTIALNLVGLLFMLPLSLGLASAIRVGNLIGEKNYTQANYATNFSLKISLLVASVNMIAIIVFGSFLISIYTDNSEVAMMALVLLYYAVIFQIPDAVGFSAVGSLRGHKDTFGPMVNLVISYWVFALPLGVYFAFGDGKYVRNQAEGMWIGMIIGIVVSMILNLRRLKTKKNKLKELF